MATETKSATSGSGWSSSSNITVSDSACANTDQIADLIAVVPAFTLTNFVSFGGYHFRVKYAKTTGASTALAYVSSDGGSSYCSGHNVTNVGTTCAASTYNDGYINCGHAQAPTTEALLKSANMRIKISTTSEQTLKFNFVDHIEHRATFENFAAPTDLAQQGYARVNWTILDSTNIYRQFCYNTL